MAVTGRPMSASNSKARLMWPAPFTLKKLFSSLGFRAAAVSTTVITTGKFYHLVGTYDGHDIKLYVNGVLERTQAANFDHS